MACYPTAQSISCFIKASAKPVISFRADYYYRPIFLNICFKSYKKHENKLESIILYTKNKNQKTCRTYVENIETGLIDLLEQNLYRPNLFAYWDDI